MGSATNTIVWFRRDLRIEDNPALAMAVREGCVLPVFIWCPNEEGQFYPGRVSRWWLKQSLTHLDRSLRSLGSPLVLIKAESTLAALLRCIEATGATKLVYNHLYDPVSLVRDNQIKSQLGDNGISVISFNGDLLYEPWEVYDEDGHAFTSFDAFWKKCLNLPIELTPILPPWGLVAAAGVEAIQSCTMEDLGLENLMEQSSNALLSRRWSPGCYNADKMLNDFVEGHLSNYSNTRMKMAGTTTSLLSPYLHFGELSVRKIYQSVRMKQIQWAKEGNSVAEESVNLFLKSIGLREYSRYLCFNFPFAHERSLLGNIRHYPWHSDEGHYKSWALGRTGYPLVDAGMRELWATGWIHNSTRVIVSSFFVKFLLLPWTWGMKYFWDTLLDADLESDILGWQYISGSLPDGHELRRLDSPEIQGQMCDPEGEYVRIWLPELARLPTEWIHHPWDAPESLLRASGIELGLNYPNPIVDVHTARERLDNAVAKMWELDSAARAANSHGSGEVVAENHVDTRTLGIPRVSVRKEAPSATPSDDRRVPSIQNLRYEAVKKESGGPCCERTKQADGSDPECTTRMDEDLHSTAESSSARKRFIAACQDAPACSYSAVPANAVGMVLDQHVSHAFFRLHPWQEGDMIEVDKELDAQSRCDGFRQCKRPCI